MGSAVRNARLAVRAGMQLARPTKIAPGRLGRRLVIQTCPGLIAEHRRRFGGCGHGEHDQVGQPVASDYSCEFIALPCGCLLCTPRDSGQQNARGFVRIGSCGTSSPRNALARILGQAGRPACVRWSSAVAAAIQEIAALMRRTYFALLRQMAGTRISSGANNLRCLGSAGLRLRRLADVAKSKSPQVPPA